MREKADAMKGGGRKQIKRKVREVNPRAPSGSLSKKADEECRREVKHQERKESRDMLIAGVSQLIDVIGSHGFCSVVERQQARQVQTISGAAS